MALSQHLNYVLGKILLSIFLLNDNALLLVYLKVWIFRHIANIYLLNSVYF